MALDRTDDEIRAAFEDIDEEREHQDPRADARYMRRAPVAAAQPPRFSPAVGKCGDCPESGPLFVRAGSGDRRVCARCSGKDHRRQVERGRDLIRALKEAAAVGDGAKAHDLLNDLAAIVGEQQAGSTMQAIRQKLEEGSRPGGRR